MNPIVELALGLATLLTTAIQGIMNSAGLSAEAKAQTIALIRQRCDLDNAHVQALELRDVEKVKDPNATPPVT